MFLLLVVHHVWINPYTWVKNMFSAEQNMKPEHLSSWSLDTHSKKDQKIRCYRLTACLKCFFFFNPEEMLSSVVFSHAKTPEHLRKTFRITLHVWKWLLTAGLCISLHCGKKNWGEKHLFFFLITIQPKWCKHLEASHHTAP